MYKILYQSYKHGMKTVQTTNETEKGHTRKKKEKDKNTEHQNNNKNHLRSVEHVLSSITIMYLSKIETITHTERKTTRKSHSLHK